MGFRFRLGPLTFGRSGVRLSLWRGGIGFSTPLSKKGRTFGKVGLGPVRWYGQSRIGRPPSPIEETPVVTSEEGAAIEAFRADQRFLERLRDNGQPWRGVQERLKEELPPHLVGREDVAYGLVPKAMSAVFGRQGFAWSTEKRPAKSGSGETTWVVVKR